MKYFDYMHVDKLKKIFFREPIYFDKNTDINILKYSIGALLYIPAIRYDFLKKSLNIKGVTSLVICLEDSIGKICKKEAISNIHKFLDDLNKNYHKNDIPLIFIRPKNYEQMCELYDFINEYVDIITGIVIPKSNHKIINDFLNKMKNTNLYYMPIIESLEFIYEEYRQNSFIELFDTLKKNKDKILNIRVGSTDLFGIYGMKKDYRFSVYDNLVYQNFMSSLINYVHREELDIPISAGVYEFFDMTNKCILDKYIQEILLDRYNGLVGKTVIHPNQINIVQSLYTVKYEEYMDAKAIIENDLGKYGALKNISKNGMNEINPHRKWAKKILLLSKVYGVLNEGVTYDELFEF